jgi:hypothetical protein
MAKRPMARQVANLTAQEPQYSHPKPKLANNVQWVKKTMFGFANSGLTAA